jgi:hypothetical protein
MRVAIAIGLSLAAVGVAGAAVDSPGGSNRIVRFADLPRGAVPGIPRDVHSVSRIVGRLDGRTIATAPTRNGNYCDAFWSKTHKSGWAGCRVRGARGGGRRGDFRSYLIGATVKANGKSILAVSGSTATGPGPRLDVVYADGQRERLTVIWVGDPIRAGFFYRAIPSTHLGPSRRAKSLELRSGSRLIAREVLLLPTFPFPPAGR